MGMIRQSAHRSLAGRSRGRRLLRRVSGLLTVVLVVTLADIPAAAAAEPEWEPPASAETQGVDVSAISPVGRPTFAAADAVVTGSSPVVWPGPETATVNLPADSAALAGAAGADGAPQPGRAGRTQAGELPIRIGAAPQTERTRSATPHRVRVSVPDRQVARAMGVAGILVSLARDDDQPTDGSVTVDVDYSGFRHAYGGDWASRLQVSVLGSCDRHPARGLREAGECGEVTRLATANDHRAGRLAAVAPLAGDGGSTLLAITAAPSGDNGDYTATSLSPAGTWQVSAQTGGFSWSYPVRVVPGVGGPEPNLSLSYSSQAVDGRTGNTNTQGSWIGDGWDMWPGYIERRYRGCAEDMDPIDGQSPNNPHGTGDQCWFNDNATMSLNGRAVELVSVGGGVYRGVDDDGSRIERLKDSSLGNGDNTGEYWRVTTTDGLQYFFGRHRRPAYPTDGAATNSTWTVPVYGNHPGEPCHQSGDFSGSRCTQAWRWNLDYVVDPHGNSMTLFYGRETGAYAREADLDLRTTYHRGGHLTRIEYGTRTGSEHAAPAPARVVFDTADRCLPGSGCDQGQAPDWPDVPWDQFCESAPCTIDQLAPTFWTQKRLAKVRTQVWRGAGHSDVDSVTLRHDYLDAGAADGEGVPMWLSGITRTGHVTAAGGSQASDPEITFDPGSTPLANRVDGPNDGKTWLNRWRVKTIGTESGALVGVIYSDTECTLATVPEPHQNGRRCFPQWYGGNGQEPTLDWFHKYVVDTVIVEDATGASPRMETHWDYLDDPAWHYDDSELVDADRRTWGQWRGYSNVRVRTGIESAPQTTTEYLYLRGMHGDRASPAGGTRTVQVTDSQGVAITDHEAHAGFLRESIAYNGHGGAWISGEIHTPWRHGPTASSGPLKAWLTGSERTRVREALAGGGVRWTRTDTTFETAFGMPVTMNQLGDEASSSDDRCARYEYARNLSSWLVDKVSRTTTVGVGCGTTPQVPDDVLSDVRTFYDNPSTHGAAPTRGLPVKVQEVGSWSGSSPVWVTTAQSTYDVHGRSIEMTDEIGRESTIAFTPTTGGPVTATTATNPLGHSTTTVMEPAWGRAVRTTDPNGHVAELTYDGLGRVTAAWVPGRNRATQSPSVEFDYLIRNDAPSAVITRELLPIGGAYLTTVSLFDGMLRARQTQAQAPGGGRTISDTFYDSRGLTAWTSKEFYDDSGAPPDTTLVGPAGQAEFSGIVENVYDGAGRVIHEITKALGTETWRSSYAYGGDRVHFTPPQGGTATTTITDARGQTVALRQYHGPSPTGAYDEITYGYTERGELASVDDESGNTWTYAYDQRGRQISATDPDAGTTTSTYDAAGQLLASTDGRGLTLGYTYDALGRQTSMRDGSPTGPKRAEWIYDTLTHGTGQLTRSIRHDGGDHYVSEVTGYDPAGRPTGTRVIIPAAEDGLAGTYETSLTYHPDGSVNTVQLPAVGDLPSENLVFAYNDVGLQTELTSALSIYVYEVVYNKLGELTQRVLGNFGKRVAVTHLYDESTGRLVNTSAIPENKPEAMDLAYEYDDAGNLTRIADSPGSASPNDTQCFRYDHLRRATEAWTPASTAWWNCLPIPQASALGGPAPYWHSWTYDPTGNRLTETQHAAGGDTVATYQYPNPGAARPHAVTQVDTAGPGGSSLDTFDYDPAGNMTERLVDGDTETLTFDAEGRVVESAEGTGTTSYLYDADGGRLIRRDPDGSTLYLGGQELRWDATTGTQTCTRYYTHLGSSIGVRTNAGLTWTVTDHHNTAEVAVRESDMQVQRRRTLPFGEVRGAEPAWWAGDKGFLGGTEDPSGLTHLGARLYDPGLGRFVSVDPVMLLTDPQQMHGYAYANNNPLTWSDPSGLCAPDADNFCPGYSVSNQPVANGPPLPSSGCRSYDPCANPGAPGEAVSGLGGGGGGGSSGGGNRPIVGPVDPALAGAERAAEEAKQKIIDAAKALLKIAMDELGITAALDCFTTGDLGACAETALNVASSFVGGLAGKILVKYGAPWKWKKAANLVKRVWNVLGDLVGGVKSWWKNSRLAKQLANDVPVTYRGDMRGPDEIFEKGFEPRGNDLDLLSHARGAPGSGYVATSTRREVAEGFGPNVYAIRQRGVDVNEALGRSSPFPHEREIAMPGGVTRDCIVGCSLPSGRWIPNPNYGG